MFPILSWYLYLKYNGLALLQAVKFSRDASRWLINSQTDSNSNFTRNDNSFQNQLVFSPSLFVWSVFSRTSGKQHRRKCYNISPWLCFLTAVLHMAQHRNHTEIITCPVPWLHCKNAPIYKHNDRMTKRNDGRRDLHFIKHTHTHNHTDPQPHIRLDI